MGGFWKKVLAATLLALAVAIKPTAILPFLALFPASTVGVLALVTMFVVAWAYPGWIQAAKLYRHAMYLPMWGRAVLAGTIFVGGVNIASTLENFRLRGEHLVYAAILAYYVGIPLIGGPIPNEYALAPLVLLMTSPSSALLGSIIFSLVVGMPALLVLTFVGMLVALSDLGPTLLPGVDTLIHRWSKVIGLVATVLIVVSPLLDVSNQFLPQSLWTSDIEHLYYCSALGPLKYEPWSWPWQIGGCVYPGFVFAPWAALGLIPALLVGKALSVASLWAISAARRWDPTPFLCMPVLFAARLDNPTIWTIALVAWAIRLNEEE